MTFYNGKQTHTYIHRYRYRQRYRYGYRYMKFYFFVLTEELTEFPGKSKTDFKKQLMLNLIT